MEFTGLALPLSQTGVDSVTTLLGITPPDLWAILTVETDGCGFLPDRRPLILFERHVFHQRTNGAFDVTHPTISTRTPGGYLGGAREYDRLAEAVALDRLNALSSTSWGIGQVMGFDAATAGFVSVEAMVSAVVDGEDAQIRATANFLRARRLQQTLARHDWQAFARGYNGPDFAKNQYDTRLAGAFEMFFHGPLPNLQVRQAQVLLMYLGIDAGGVDGVLGKRTRSAILAFKAQQGLPPSDELDDSVLARLASVAAASKAP